MIKKKSQTSEDAETLMPSPEAPPPTKAEATSMTFPIVGIGASAGGLEAFEKFFLQMPPDSGMAFVVVQHTVKVL